MVRIVALAALFLLLTQSPARAQEATEAAQHVQSAVTLARAGDLDGAATETEQAIATARTLGDRFNGLFVLAQIRAAQGRHREAGELGERAANLIRAEAPDDLESLEAALQLAEQAYYEAGDRDAWFRLGQEIIALRNVELALYWTDLDGTPEHIFSAAHCPIRLGPAVRTEMANLNQTGTDEQCQYQIADMPGPRVTVFITRITSVDTLDALYDSTAQQIDVAFEHPRPISSTTLDFNGIPVRGGMFAQGATRTGVWLSLVHGWSLKLRLTHQGELSEAQVNAVADALYADLPSIEAQLGQCDALADRPEANTVTPGFVDAIALLMIDEAAGMTAEHQCFLGLPDFNDGEASLAWSELDESGNVVRYVAGTRSANSDYRVIVGQGSVPTGHSSVPYVLTSRNSEGLFLLGAFETLPSPAQFLEYAERAAAGELTSYASMQIDDDGNPQISLGDDLLTAQESGPN